jgi:hypothetical protein
MYQRVSHHLLAGLLLLFLFVWPPVVRSMDSGQQRVDQEVVDSYVVSVWTWPEVLLTGEVYFSVNVTTEAGQPALDRDVFVTMMPVAEKGMPLAGIATTVDGNNSHHGNFHGDAHYGAIVTVPEAGQYEATVTIINPTGGEEEVSFIVEVDEPTSWLKFAIYFLVMATFVMGVSLSRESLATWRKFKVYS